MYEESSNNTSIKGIVVKILLIVLVICILMWIFPTKKDLEKGFSNISYNTGSNVNIDPLLNTIFGQNIRIMQNAGRAYYYSATLPKNVGDSSSVTLQELINKKMLVEFKDKNNASCNTTASYVQLTKTGTNKYEMKTYLQCNGEEDYIIDNLGCTDLCPNTCTNTSNNTTKPSTKPSKEEPDKDGNTGSGNDNNNEETKKYKYLYSCKETTTGWSGWSDWSTTSVSSSSTRKVETKTESTYGKTGTITKYRIETSSVTYVNTIPAGAKNCNDGVTKRGVAGYYIEYTCTTEKRIPYQEDTYGYTTVTYYRYKTKTSSSNTYTVWSNTDNDTTLKNKGCTVIKSELVTTK